MTTDYWTETRAILKWIPKNIRITATIYKTYRDYNIDGIAISISVCIVALGTSLESR